MSRFLKGGLLGKLASSLVPGGSIVQAGLPIAAGLIGRVVAGRASDPRDIMLEQEQIQAEINAGINQAEQNALRNFQASLMRTGRRSIEDLRASGVTGSGLGASLEGLFRQQGESILDRLAQLGQARGQRAAAFALQKQQAALQASARENDRRNQLINSFIEGGVGLSNYLSNRDQIGGTTSGPLASVQEAFPSPSAEALSIAQARLPSMTIARPTLPAISTPLPPIPSLARTDGEVMVGTPFSL